MVAADMGLLAGATDVYGLKRLGGLYVSFMSGNTTQLGVALGGGDGPRAVRIVGLVVVFVLGAAAGAVTLVLAGPLLWFPLTVACFLWARGMLNAATNRIGEAQVSLTYVTGTLVKSARAWAVPYAATRPAGFGCGSCRCGSACSPTPRALSWCSVPSAPRRFGRCPPSRCC